MNPSQTSTSRTLDLFLTRGVVAIVWAAVFAATANSLTTGVTVGAGILLVGAVVLVATSTRSRLW